MKQAAGSPGWKEAAAAISTAEKEQPRGIQIVIDGQLAVNASIDLAALGFGSQQTSLTHERVSKNTPMTTPQAREILSRIDARSAEFLRQIAANGGQITFGEARTTYGIGAPGDWSAYASIFGRGITRAVRKVLADTSARLVWWEDSDPTWKENDFDAAKLFIDGHALESLREVITVD